ncbi:MAG: DUF6249 domain-containing protein [Lacunisphaera sp.]
MILHLLPLAVSGADVGLYMGLGGMVTGTIFGGLGMYFHHKRQALWHETARLALEKGQPVPPSPDWDESSTTLATSHVQIRANRIRGLLISGLINVALGAGLYLGLSQISGALANFAAIPGFIGVALLLAAFLDLLLTRNSQS